MAKWLEVVLLIITAPVIASSLIYVRFLANKCESSQKNYLEYAHKILIGVQVLSALWYLLASLFQSSIAMVPDIIIAVCGAIYEYYFLRLVTQYNAKPLVQNVQ